MPNPAIAAPRPQVTRAAYLADAPTRPLRLEADPTTGMVRGVWPLTWEGVRDYPGEAYGRPGGTVRVAHLPDQVRAPGFLRLVRNVASTLDHPSRVGRDGRAVDLWLHADAAAGAGRLPDPPPGGEWVDPRAVLVGWGGEPELRDVEGEHGPVSLPVTEVTIFDPRAKDLIGWGARDSSLGYSPLMVWEPGTYTAPDGTTHDYDAWHLLDPDHPLAVQSPHAPAVNHFAVGIWAGRGGLQSKALDALPGAGPVVPARFVINAPAVEAEPAEAEAPGPKAAGVAFPDGTAALWCRETGACTFYRSVATLMAEHGEGGAALLEWIDPPPPAPLLDPVPSGAEPAEPAEATEPEGEGEGEGAAPAGKVSIGKEAGEGAGAVLVINVTAGDEDGEISLPIAKAPASPPWQDFTVWADPGHATPVDAVESAAIRNAVRAAVTPYREAVAGWVGYSEADGAIAFWADNGLVLAWAERGPDGGVVGEPVAVDPRPRAAATDSKGKAAPGPYAGGVKIRSTSPAAVAAARLMAASAVTPGTVRDASLTIEIPDEYAAAVEPVIRALEEAYAAKAAEAAQAQAAQGAAETQAAQAQAAAEAAQGAQAQATEQATGLQAANTEQAAQLKALQAQLDELARANAVDKAHAARWRAHEASVLVADAQARGLTLDAVADHADPHAVRSAILRQLAPANADRVIAAGPEAVEATVTSIMAVQAKPRTSGLRDAAATPAPAPAPAPATHKPHGTADVGASNIFAGFAVG